MSGIETSIEVERPVRTVYDQWTQFEEFPHFMEGVEEVRQLDDMRLHWGARIGGNAGTGTPSSGADPRRAGGVDRPRRERRTTAW